MVTHSDAEKKGKGFLPLLTSVENKVNMEG